MKRAGRLLIKKQVIILVILLTMLSMPSFGQLKETPFSPYIRGIRLLDEDKYEEAIGAFDKSIEMDPYYTQPRIAKGLALKELGKYEEAIKNYDQAIEIDPESELVWSPKGQQKFAPAWALKGDVLFLQGKYEDAIKAFDKAIKVDPTYWEAWYNGGQALKAVGRNTEGEAAIAKARNISAQQNLTWG